MFNEQVKVILYAQAVPAAAEFWQTLGFSLISLDEVDGSTVAELAVTENSGTHLVIYDRAFIAENTADASEPAPALIFSSDDVLGLYQSLQAKEIPMGDLTKVGDELVFNFVDLDGNYFVVSGK
ncbi:VOC family protein [Enterococcus sp. CSURQ0835]|uniref:VOC family protein n=1 Tax=Enterococcus sp. CSURQ0835 TaxID=2681394 RepID=UPI00135712E8|nr:VOC family protein [Enterococcus sp. CSURQ0835]